LSIADRYRQIQNTPGVKNERIAASTLVAWTQIFMNLISLHAWRADDNKRCGSAMLYTHGLRTHIDNMAKKRQ
jgi:hypothetical protein